VRADVVTPDQINYTRNFTATAVMESDESPLSPSKYGAINF